MKLFDIEDLTEEEKDTIVCMVHVATKAMMEAMVARATPAMVAAATVAQMTPAADEPVTRRSRIGVVTSG
jgi:hypothetical protein